MYMPVLDKFQCFIVSRTEISKMLLFWKSPKNIYP